jgi:DNA-damage-inducible protein J
VRTACAEILASTKAYAPQARITDAWFREKVREALEDYRPAAPDDEMEAHFAGRRAAALRKAE